MVPQVQVVAILMIVHGVLVSLIGIYYALVVPILYGVLLAGPGRPAGSTSTSTDLTILGVMGGLHILAGLAILLVAALNIVSGIRCLRFRGRTLAIVALFGNLTPILTCWLAPLFTCWAVPISLGLMIYGLIVLFQSDVSAAFAAVAAGMPPERVKQRARHPEDDDFDDSSPPRPRPPTPRSPSENIQRRPDEYQ